MSTTDPGTGVATSDSAVTVAQGVQVGAGRDTSQLNAQGIVVQGISFPITLPGGTTTTVFVPNSALGNVTQVQALFDAKINALLAIPGQG